MLDNSTIAELLARQAESASPPANKALRRAARRALLWPEEAAQLLAEDRKLTDLAGVGPYIERLIRDWLNSSDPAPEPPRIRDGFLTMTQAQSLAKHAPWVDGIRGDLQMHTQWSDGEGSINDMANAAIERGYEYIAITDHSKGLKIARGIDESRLREQAAAIGQTNRTLHLEGNKMRVLRSIELNLNPRGEGDMDPHPLEDLDLVLGCFHSSLRKREDQTERYLAALQNPSIQILGHPRGRIYNYRLGLEADWQKVFNAAAELDKAIEIDAYPDRQDISPDLVALAAKAGCRISLGTDSHGQSQLRFMAFAAASAIRGGIPRDRLLNFMPADDLLAWARSVRESAQKHARPRIFVHESAK